MDSAEVPTPLKGPRRLAIGALFVAILAFVLLTPLAGLVVRWRDGDIDDGYRYGWQMYSKLDR